MRIHLFYCFDALRDQSIRIGRRSAQVVLETVRNLWEQDKVVDPKPPSLLNLAQLHAANNDCMLVCLCVCVRARRKKTHQRLHCVTPTTRHRSNINRLRPLGHKQRQHKVARRHCGLPYHVANGARLTVATGTTRHVEVETAARNARRRTHTALGTPQQARNARKRTSTAPNTIQHVPGKRTTTNTRKRSEHHRDNEVCPTMCAQPQWCPKMVSRPKIVSGNFAGDGAPAMRGKSGFGGLWPRWPPCVG